MSKDVPHDEEYNRRLILDNADLHLITLELNPTELNQKMASSFVDFLKGVVNVHDTLDKLNHPIVITSKKEYDHYLAEYNSIPRPVDENGYYIRNDYKERRRENIMNAMMRWNYENSEDLGGHNYGVKKC